LGIGRKARQVAIPPRGQLAPLHLLDLGGELRELLTVVGKERVPAPMRLGAARADPGIKLLHDPFGYKKLGILRPAIGALGKPDLLLAQRFAMGGGRINLVGRAVADVAIENDESRSALGVPENRERILDALKIIRVANPQDVPSIGKKARRDILCEGDAGLTLDRDVIVVIDPTQVVELEMASERGRLRTEPPHQAAVAANRIDVIVEDVEARSVVAVGKPLPRHRHADTGRDSLTERAGRRLDTGHPVILRMPRRLAAQLAEVADVVEGDRRL